MTWSPFWPCEFLKILFLFLFFFITYILRSLKREGEEIPWWRWMLKWGLWGRESIAFSYISSETAFKWGVAWNVGAQRCVKKIFVVHWLWGPSLTFTGQGLAPMLNPQLCLPLSLWAVLPYWAASKSHAVSPVTVCLSPHGSESAVMGIGCDWEPKLIHFLWRWFLSGPCLSHCCAFWGQHLSVKSLLSIFGAFL